MEEKEVGLFGVEDYWWWTAGSAGQLWMGIVSYKKGYAGTCSLMPLRAFVVSSLFLSSAASASMASLCAHGLHSVEDIKVAGANIRSGLGIPPRVRKDVS
ncbi:hypothetical protein LIER_41394 [Lithospermum erythrorhizon]|uniref:Uncharacterized protein n=1 Tax=Lithospermum erythrorhizon TaxID=34254 RepID=A0AAV3RBU9_LITER